MSSSCCLTQVCPLTAEDMLFHNKPTLTKNADPGALLAAWPQSLKRISSYWMPELRRLGVHAPVILVGTKNDLGKQQEQELSTVRSSPTGLANISSCRAAFALCMHQHCHNSF